VRKHRESRDFSAPAPKPTPGPKKAKAAAKAVMAKPTTGETTVDKASVGEGATASKAAVGQATTAHTTANPRLTKPPLELGRRGRKAERQISGALGNNSSALKFL
jgi:hypothetical protein